MSKKSLCLYASSKMLIVLNSFFQLLEQVNAFQYQLNDKHIRVRDFQGFLCFINLKKINYPENVGNLAKMRQIVRRHPAMQNH